MTAALLLASLALLSPAALSPSGNAPDDLAPGEVVEGELGARLDAWLERLEGLGFSGVVGVDFSGEPLLIRGYGMADREAGRPFTPDTVLTVGSITKQFTGAAVMKLVDMDKISVDDPLTRFFDDVPPDKQGITVHHLLSQGSGLSDPPLGDFDLRATADFIRELAFDTPLLWEPGEAFRYANVNFSLAAMIVERVSGQSYEAFLREHLFEPAGMHDTGYLLPGYATERLAVGYDHGRRWGTVLERPMLDDGPAWTLRGNGGIHSTVGDMLRWHHALQEGLVLSGEALEQYQAPHIPEGFGGSHYAYGWSVMETGGGRLITHNGGNMVFFADFLRFVDEGFTIFVATNSVAATGEDVAFQLASIVHEREPRALPETLPRDRASLERYAGSYPLGDGSALVVRNLGDRLLLTGVGEEARTLLLGDAGLALEERTRELAASALAGDYAPFLASYGGHQGEDSIRAELDDGRARKKEELGALVGLGASATDDSRGSLRVAVEARYERGSAWLWMSWENGRVRGFVLADERPFEAVAPVVELFPFSTTDFRTWDGMRGTGPGCDFVLEGDEVVALRLPEPPIELGRE